MLAGDSYGCAPRCGQWWRDERRDVGEEAEQHIGLPTAMSDDASLLAVGGTVFERGAEGVRRLEGPKGTADGCLAFSPSGRFILLGDGSGGTSLWDRKTGAVANCSTRRFRRLRRDILA